MPRNPSWRREELILALELYKRIGATDSRNSEVLGLSQTLNSLHLHMSVPSPSNFRNANSVAMKLANFASIDPTYPGVSLSRCGKLDRAIWTEFAEQDSLLKQEVAKILGGLQSG
jgi:hypothetical protein